ncbi:DUF4226 domain-containing protein [Mycolicibacterium sp. XJ870]
MTDENSTATELAAPPAPATLSPNEYRSRPSLAVAPRLPISPAGANAAGASPASTSQATPTPAAAAGTPAATGSAAAPAAAPATTAGTPAVAAPPAVNGSGLATADPAAGEAEPGDSDPAAEDEQDSDAEASAMDPDQAANLATGLAEPLISAGVAIPTALLTTGVGLLEPFATILAAFGEGTPELAGSSGLSSDLLDQLDSIDADSGVTGDVGVSYQSTADGYSQEAQALDSLDRELSKVLEDSANNSSLGRAEIERIIDEVKSKLQALESVADTPQGQQAVLNAIAEGLQEAGAVVTSATSNDALNASKVQAIAAQYQSDLNPSADQETPSALGDLTSASSPREVAAAILGEARRRGYSEDQAIAILSTAMQESGLDPTAIGGGGAWHGIFQQDTSYPGRDDPNANIAEFFDRLDAKGGSGAEDTWKTIFWLQQRPGELSAEAAYANGRQAYLSEIQSQSGAATQLYRELTPRYV